MLVALALAGATAAYGRTETPRVSAPSLAFSGYVVDAAGVLSAPAERRLTAALGALQRDTQHQLAVVTVGTLRGDTVEHFTTALANRWGVGRRGYNDGVVLLIAPHERKTRISVGNGLRAVLPDPFCQAVIDRRLIPAFARGDYDGGVEAGVAALVTRLRARRSSTD